MRLRVRGHRVAGLAVLVLAGASVGCGAGGDEGGPEDEAAWVVASKATARAFATIRWDTVFSLGGRLEDTLLLKPRLLAARGGSLYVYDYIDHRLKAFDAEGRLR